MKNVCFVLIDKDGIIEQKLYFDIIIEKMIDHVNLDHINLTFFTLGQIIFFFFQHPYRVNELKICCVM